MRGSSTPPGAFVCSLDFELMWGVRDRFPPGGGAYRENLLGARRAIPGILDAFERHGVRATWATVGFLFAASREELLSFAPAVRPAYARRALSPYFDEIGRDERDDPLHFGASLVAAIRERPGQEIGSHTFSHYYCLEPGQTREAFEADLASAVRIAAAHGIGLRSLVFPRNQVNDDYLPAVAAAGFAAIRGNPRSWVYRGGTDEEERGTLRRAGRLLDSYAALGGSGTLRWGDVPLAGGPCDVAASQFLRPCSSIPALEALRFRRIAKALRTAAETGRIFHLWWHPHNFGRRTAENLRFLEAILEVFSSCRARLGMRSMSMGQVAASLGR